MHDLDPPRPDEADLRERIAQLETALHSRPTIEQAKGMLMLLARCDADAAFTLLTAVSQRCNRKLRDVAGVFVERLPTDQALPADIASALDARLRRGALDSGA